MYAMLFVFYYVGFCALTLTQTPNTTLMTCISFVLNVCVNVNVSQPNIGRFRPWTLNTPSIWRCSIWCNFSSWNWSWSFSFYL